MFNLTNDEIVMVDGGGDGAGVIVREVGKWAIGGFAWDVATHPAGNGSSFNNGTQNISGNGYMGQGLQTGGGMAGSPTGGRGYGY
ncbi:hypothetical protein KIV40_01215 [Vibrio sp. D173a]|uniref:hypothetical protein n=1 Tax=Vibrio sp. D173a TaxID=2836349 RepID=UPI002552FCC5|nr:hypothetical protein [Vibrio sp. D173a]MDK9754084.1 hypothetical protein [Vibrio sp. D173a]